MENGLTSAFNDDIRQDQNGQALLEESKTIERLPLQLKQGAKISAVRNIHRESDQKTDTCMSPSRQVSLGGYNSRSAIHQNNAATSQEAGANTMSSCTQSKSPKNAAYWIEVLGLNNTDKCLLQGSY